MHRGRYAKLSISTQSGPSELKLRLQKAGIGVTSTHNAQWRAVARLTCRHLSQPSMPPTPAGRQRLSSLVVVKIAHTAAWAFFAGCIVAIPLVSWRGHHAQAAWLSAIVLGEVLILVVNGWRCPLTAVAARFTEDRHDNFDIYLPLWLARHNKLIFGALYVLGMTFAFVRWREG